MEVYSIITDLHLIEINSPTNLLKGALARNKYLLTKYAATFQRVSSRQFRTQVRLALKQFRPNRRIGYTQRYSSRQMEGTTEKTKESLRLLTPLNMKIIQSCSKSDRLVMLRNLENLGKTRTRTEKQGRQSKRVSAQYLNYELKKVWLGEELEKQSDQKIQSFLSNRYKSTLTRLKNLYSSSKSILQPTLRRPSYFINHSLAGYITKNLAKR